MYKESEYYMVSSENHIYDGLIKVKLMHFSWASWIIPEIIISKNRYFRPITLDICTIYYLDENNVAKIKCNLSNRVSCTIEFDTSSYLYSLPGNSLVYSCKIHSDYPGAFKSASLGKARLSEDSVELELFHHTSKEGLNGINKSQEIWSSAWNLQGTKKFESQQYVYFTNLEKIKSREDLKKIAMSDDAVIEYRLDQYRGDPRDKLSLPVYRRNLDSLSQTLRFWIDWSLIAPYYLFFHSGSAQPGGLANWYEVLLPNIFRIAVSNNGTVRLTDDLVSSLNVPAIAHQTHLICGNATVINGLKAPWIEIEEPNSFIWYSDPDVYQQECLGLWKSKANSDQFSVLKHPLPKLEDSD